MGCGASKATSTADAPAEPPRGGKKASDSGNNIAPKGQTTTHSGADTDAPKKKPSKLDEADGIGANFDAAAAVTVAAGTATLVEPPMRMHPSPPQHLLGRGSGGCVFSPMW